MTQPWQPEHVVSIEDAKKYIEEQFPELFPVELVEYGKGFDNTVYFVNHDYVFRFPRRKIAVRLLEKENRFLPELAGMLPLEIPEPLYFGQPTGDYPWPFTGYKVVGGQMLTALSRSASHASIPDLANFLKILHQFPVNAAKKLNVPYDELKRADMAKRLPILEDQVKQLIKRKLYTKPELLKDYIENLQVIPQSDDNVLIHGDLHVRNIVVDQKGRLKGVIDWGDMHIGSRAVDLSIVYSFLPPESREFFYEKYGNVQKSERDLARFIAIYILSILLLYGADHEDQLLIDICQNSLDWALSES